ncbi:MAG TPA: M15 family metallopeptidase [Candidatus Limiplasma sp.]|nr:M15 family metallopeptidase [Candidatus Limiplasma sp.]HRX07769.1 M15 family metallopeptidase [Candidatus Limiplasma sp.]
MKRLLSLILLICILLSVSSALAEAEWTYAIPLSLLNSEYTVLVNRDHMLTKDEKPENLVSVNLRKKTSTVIQLDAVAAKALTDLFAESAKITSYSYREKVGDGDWQDAVFNNEDGLKLLLYSGYRSYSSQYTIYHNYLDRNNGVDDGISSPPGASEHQTGLACDVISVGYNNTHQYMNEEFYETPEAQWMEENAAAFGFIIRYPNGKEEITKVPYEPWHLRYVGREIAEYIQSHCLTLEEFTDEWQAALDTFVNDGGDIQAQLLLESTMAPSAVTTTVLDIYGEDGDAEVSLTMF